MGQYKLDEIRDFKPTTAFFVGVDSDGCAFNTMEVKQKECFRPNFIKYFGFQGVFRWAREAGEFVNLYSLWLGGIPRFAAGNPTLEKII
jgi:hypothetical protein